MPVSPFFRSHLAGLLAIGLGSCVLDTRYVGESTEPAPTSEDDNTLSTPDDDTDSQGQPRSCEDLAQRRLRRCLHYCENKKFDCRRCERDQQRFLELCAIDRDKALALPQVHQRRKKKKS